MHEGIETIASNHSVDETVARLKVLLAEKAIKLFCVIDHAAEAASAGLSMRPTRLMIFGSATAGTPVMKEAPSAGLDLPLKILVVEAESGRTLLFWNNPAWIQERHDFTSGLAENFAVVGALAEAAAQ